MKKTLSVVLVSLMAFGALTGCSKSGKVSSSIDSVSTTVAPAKVTVTLDKATLSIQIGKTSALTATTSPAGEMVQFSSDNPDVAMVDNDGVVTGVKVGTCNVTAKTKDKETAVCAVTVTDEDIPAIPASDTTAKEIDMSSVVAYSGTVAGYGVAYDATKKLTTVSFTKASLANGWSNSIATAIPETEDFTRKTALHIVARANSIMTGYYKLVSSVDGAESCIKEGEIPLTTRYADKEFEFEDASRYLLGVGELKFYFYAPKDGSSYTEDGKAEIAHVYMNGDKDRGIAPGEYDPSAYTSLYSFNVKGGSAAAMGDGIVDSSLGSETVASYGEDGITFTRTVADATAEDPWGYYCMKCPDNDADGNAINYTGACKLVAKVKCSEGVQLKYRGSYDGSATIYALNVTAENAQKDVYITIDIDGRKSYAQDNDNYTVFQIIPTYRVNKTYAGPLTVLLESAEVVKANA